MRMWDFPAAGKIPGTPSPLSHIPKGCSTYIQPSKRFQRQNSTDKRISPIPTYFLSQETPARDVPTTPAQSWEFQKSLDLRWEWLEQQDMENSSTKPSPCFPPGIPFFHENPLPKSQTPGIAALLSREKGDAEELWNHGMPDWFGMEGTLGIIHIQPHGLGNLPMDQIQ